jgi:diguanylate cyclase (GGDEF)-like protein
MPIVGNSEPHKADSPRPRETRLAATDRSISPSRRLIRAVICLIATLVVGSGLAIWQLRRDAIEDTKGELHSVGTIVAEQITRTLQADDLVLYEIADRIAHAGVNSSQSLHQAFSTPEIHDALARRLIDLPQTEAFAILDETGRYVNQSQDEPKPEYSLAYRRYFENLSSTADPRTYVSEPASSRSTGERTMFMARRLTEPDGSFLGVAVAVVRLNYFLGFFTGTRLEDGTSITILRNDGSILLHYPDVGLPLQARLPETLKWYGAVASGGGQYRAPVSLAYPDGAATLVSVHPLRTYPVVINVGRSEWTALASWRRQAESIGLGVGIASVIAVMLALALGRQIQRIEKAQQRIEQHITAITASEARLAEQSTMLQTTLEHMNQGVMMVDADGTVVLCNRRLTSLLALPYDWLQTRPPFAEVVEFLSTRGEFAAGPDAPFDTALLLSSHAVYERRRANGTVFEARTAPMPCGGWVRTFTDITARAAAEEMLGLAASHDQLTGLANRNGLDNRLDAALATARRGGGELALLCLDLDRFKAVNDTFGHEAGDHLLIQVAARMHEIARSTDVIARLGGDEFAIVLPGANLAGAELVSRRLLDSIGLPYLLNGAVARIGVSIGIAIYPADGATAEQLMRNADTALYKAKALGRNIWFAYTSEDGQREQIRMRLRQDIRTAVEQQDFTLAYQPICDAASGEPVAFEALLRWIHPTGTPVLPAEFIPIAEQTGMIIPLGRWVIETACAEAAAWDLPLRVAVNLSPAQFRDRALPNFISDVLARSGLAADRLDLEVTEGLLLEDVGDVVLTMQKLRSMGIRMVLDDFGTAHSNLSYLRGFPFDAVKIDRSFLRALNSDSQARALVEAMLTMARALDLDVVGEGVETPEQLALLAHLRCRWVQGFLLGRPQPADITRDLIMQLAAKKGRSRGHDVGPVAKHFGAGVTDTSRTTLVLAP